MSVIELKGENFDPEVLSSDTPVLVDFWAEWCGPCKMMSPIVDEIADDMKEKLKVGKVNIDVEQDLASKFGIMSIPTLLLFKGGTQVQQVVGAMSKEAVLSKIESFL